MVSLDFALPDVGEGLTEAEVLEWKVAVGDEVRTNDALVEVETAKAVVELPSPSEGRISAIHVEPGATVPVGTVLVSIEPLGAQDDAPGPPAEPTSPAAEESESGPAEDAPAVLVGTGPRAAAGRTRRLGARREVPRPPVAPSASPPSSRPERPRAKPPVRALARSLGVDLATLATADPITRDDVLAAAGRRGADESGTPAAGASHAAADTGARQTRTPIRGVRKAIAAAMTKSAFTAPHVTEWLTIDMTPTMELVQRLRADRAWQGVRVNPMLMVARAILLAVRRHPEINASWDEEAQEIVQHHYVNLGIAVASERGLIVPNIKEAHDMDLRALAAGMEQLVEKGRTGSSAVSDLTGGTITITNIGAFGVDAGTPLLNPGEAAILAFGAVRPTPWVVDGQIVPRQVTQLALSFDHRLVDGALGSQVLADVGRLLSDPALAFTR